MLLDAVFSLAAALFAFVILPAGDLIIGQEPPEAVRTQLILAVCLLSYRDNMSRGRGNEELTASSGPHCGQARCGMYSCLFFTVAFEVYAAVWKSSIIISRSIVGHAHGEDGK